MKEYQSILFICTGNYYRSRFAEIYLRHLLRDRNCDVEVLSRGLDIYSAGNPGPISVFTINYLEELGISMPDPMPGPQSLADSDFDQSRLVIALDEREHRPMLEKHFPHLVELVTFWSFQDVGYVSPHEMLPRLRQYLEGFAAQLCK